MQQMQFVRDLWRAVHDDDGTPFPGVHRILSRGSDDERAFLTDAINVLCVNAGVRNMTEVTLCHFGVKHPFFPGNTPPFRRAEEIEQVVAEHMPGLRFMTPAVVMSATAHAKYGRHRKLSYKAIGELLGYVTPGEQNENLTISFRVASGRSKNDIKLFSFDARALGASHLARIMDMRSIIDEACAPLGLRLTDHVVSDKCRLCPNDTK